MPDQEPEFISEEEAHAQGDKSFRNPRQFFKDKALAPYNQTYRMLALGIRDPVVDAADFFTMSFVYILIRGEEIYQEELARLNGSVEAAEDQVDLLLPREVESDPEGFRLKIRKWMRHFDKEDIEKAGELLLESSRRAKSSRVQGRDPDAIAEDSQPGK